MNIHIALRDQERAGRWALQLESLREDWNCHSPPEDCRLIITDGADAFRHYPLLIRVGEDPLADGCVGAFAQLPPLVDSLRFSIPKAFPFEEAGRNAAGFLRALGLPPRLKGFRCLCWLIAAVTGNPSLLEAMTGQLYPRAGKALGLSPAGVEKCARRAIESLWSHGSLAVLERYFGQSVDPERGKPTNREFLAMAYEHLRQKS